MQNVLANLAVSVTDLEKSPAAILDNAHGEPVAILKDDRILAYMVPPAAYEAMLELIDDAELAALIRDRAGEVPVKVALDDL
ncbi:antitoxin [Methylobacterium sp. NEAU 140]|uniref:type II toxin-antitoxin system Phd/YefM family antitoxin n=1 Tax=Methylobacterium sp. NEAU 140 TaxID=3064945 RepID=UPI002733387B|nr:antitoxin [Methylobacterium sp. NEAU 140]MDP4024313.1 antitoxin [Methylobacterium sp. NEAU 140]